MPRKSKGNKVKKAQLKRKKTKERKMKTKGRIVSRKGSKKKLLAYGSNSSSNSNNSETNSEREALISALKYHHNMHKKHPGHLWERRDRDVFNLNP